ncbi:MAG TPA: FtsX-like permease family protein [Rhizomicrobium sp.]|nr:FtsX-like permease family protein [Rhizomicrobium sp.]
MHEISALCRWNIRGLRSRLRNASIVLAGFFLVVLVFVAVLSVRDGILRSETRPGTDQLAIVTSQHGLMDTAALDIVNQAPGIARADGKPLVAAMDTGPLLIRNWRPDMLGIATVFAIDPGKAGVMPNFRVVEGRLMRPGFNEMMMGEGAKRIYPEYAAGRPIQWQRREWKIVGIYSTGSLTRDSQFLVDLRQFQGASKSGDKFSEIHVRLASPAAFAGFKKYVEGQPGLAATVKTMAEEDEEVGRQFREILAMAAGVITILMAAGATFAALNVMYANVARRGGELAVLRAVGFSRFPVLVAMLSEAVILALAGGLAGVVLAALALDGLEAKTLMGGWLVSFRLAVTPAAIAMALALTLGMGFAGGLFPAIRAARRPIAAALREE